MFRLQRATLHLVRGRGCRLRCPQDRSHRRADRRRQPREGAAAAEVMKHRDAGGPAMRQGPLSALSALNSQLCPQRATLPLGTELGGRGRTRARQLRDEDELSYREIAAVLEAEDIRPKRGERWHPETVRRMLANPTNRPPTLRKRSGRP
ncbi:recombinase family protein [Streptomyces sp. Ag82_G6-1]|uniref:recombinase family protein n=1 Tax=Streptomyces sp. Ag82_G6-1 TaxID=1938853 RepID=UPI00359C9F9B